MGQDRIERILAKRRKATEKIVDAHLYNPSKKWGEAEQEPSSDDYSFTSGIEPTKVENPYPTFSEKVAASMTPATPKNIAESLPQYKTAMDAEQAHEQRFADDADYREQWFQDNTGMGEEEFKANAENTYGERLGDLISRAETMHENIVAENAKHSTGFFETAENLRKAMANKANIDKLKGVLSSFKNNNLWSGLYEGADLLDVLSLGLSEVAGTDALKKALEKQSKGEELNEEEQFAIDASNLYDEIEETYDLLGGRSGWNKVGQGLGESAEFIAQMAGTSGMGFSTSLMKNLGLKAGKQAVKNAMGHGLAKGLGELAKQSGKVLGRGVYNFGLSYLESIPRAALTPQTYSRYIELRNERLKNGESLEGNWLQDAGRAGIEMTNEIASEIWGSTFIHDSFRAMGKGLGIDKAMDAIGLGRRRRTMFGWTPSASTREMMRRVGYSGDYLSEVTSELAGDVATNLAMGVLFNDAQWGEMATKEYWTTLLGATALQGAAMQSLNTLANIPEYKRLNSIQQKRDKAVNDIQSEQLRKDIEMAFTYDDAAEMGKALAAIDWNAYNRIDVANAMDAIRLEVPLRIATSEREESERISRFAPMMEGIMAEAYQGVDAENPMPQPISVVGSVEGTPIRVVSGDYNNPDAMLNVVNDATGEKFPVIASKVKDISEISLQDKIAESYKLMFSTEENVQRLSKVMDTLGRLAYYGKSSSADAIDIVKRAGFTVFEEGEVVTLVNGQQVEVAAPMMSDGHYLVRDNDGNTSIVGLLDVVQPNMEVAKAQVQMANQQQQEVADEATAVVQQTMENAMPSSMPEGVAFGEVWVTPQGVGRVLEYNPQAGKVYVDINLSTDQMNKEDAMEVVEVDVADLQRKPSEAEMTEARNRSVRRNALMIYDETSDAAGAIQEVEEVTQPVEQAAEATEQAPQEVPSMENVPTTADGAVDYDAITDADMYARLLTQDLGSKEEALEAVNTSIEGYTAEVSELQEKAKKEKNMTQRVALTKQAAAVQQQLDVLNEVRKSLGEGTNELNGAYTLSDEIDENGRQFVLNSQGDTAFGFIEPDSNLTPAPIMLSEGIITNPATNDGYGLVHIEARHGDQIRKAGYGSVVEFVEEVAKNYEVIKEGKNRNGVQTYLLQLTDKHNNTLMVELSGDGTYYNINTAGIFKTSYGKNRKEVYNRQTTAKQPAEVVETSRSVESNGTQTPPSLIDVSTPSVSSESKNTTSVPNMQEVEQKNVGLVQDDFTATLPNGEAELIDSLARSLGLSVEFVDQVNEGNSNAQILGNKVLIAKKNRDKAIKFLVGHEFTHRMQDLSPEAYAEFKAAVKEYMGEELYNTLLQKEIAKYREHNIYRTQEQLEDEVIADFAGSLAFETDVLDTFIAAHADKKSMWQAILDALRAIREWILKDTAYDTAEARALQNTIGKLEALFQTASEKVAEGATAQNTEARNSEKDINTLTEEEQDIIATAKANGTYLKAPNGADTNLTPRQWVQVRTKAFKKWFGDWELAAIAEYLMSDDVVAILNGDEFAKDGTPLTDKVVKYYADNHNGKVERDGLGEVLLDKRSVKDSASHGLGKAKSAAFAAVPNIITEGRIIDSQTNWKGRGYDSVTIAAPIRIGNENYVGVVVVKKSKEFNRFYLHEVMIQKSLRDGVFQTSLNAGNPSGDIAKVIKNIINANNSSKIIDANGEPKVAEHSTWNEDFYTFDINRLGESSGDEGVYGAGFYFGNVGETELYGDRAIQVYLNLHNPLVLPDAPIRGFFDYLVENFDKEGLRDIVVKQDNKTTTMGDVVDAIKAVNEAHARGEYAELIEQMSQYWYPAEERVLEQQIFRKIGLAIYPTLEPFIQYNVGRKEFSEALRNAGYDGVVYDNQEYVAFEPNQIKSADAVTYDDAGNIIPLSERFNPEKADIRYALKERTNEKVTFDNFFEGTSAIFTQISEKPTTKPDYTSRSGSRYWYGEDEKGKVRYSAKDIPSLVGVHNISLEKLRKVIKMGGLANPSVAVIDADKQMHEDYGEYSLILPKNIVDARQGKNAGTWAGDAWTPTYPQITKRMSKDKDISRYYKDTDVLPKAMRNRVRLDFDSFMDGRSANALAYWYLFDKGVAPELVDVPARYPVEIVDALNEATNGSFSMFRLSAEERARCLDAFVAYEYKGDRATYDADMAARKERLENFAKNHDKGIVRKKAQEDLDAINEYGFDYDEVSRFIRDVEWDVRHKGETDVDATIKASMDYIAENNLGAEYDAWRNSLDERYGIEEYIFDGYTNSGTRRYLPHTVKNASKWMKKQGRQGAVATFPSFGTFVAVSIPKMTTLESIRKRKNLLGKTKEEYDAFREKWENVYFELGKKLQPDAKGFDDYGYWRLIEAVGQKNPKEYIKKQYNIELSAEDVNTLNDMLDAIRTEYPARYFETKFERPLQLNDFVAAVVPDDVPMDVWGRLNDANVKIFEYEKGNSNSRAEAMQKATATEGVRFSVKDTFYSNAENAVRLIKQEKATPEQWLKMIEKNGGLKAGEDKWLGLSDWLKASDKKTLTKQEVLDYIHQNQIQIEEVNYAEVGSPFIDRATRKLEAEMKEIGIEAMREKYPDFDDFFEVFQGELVWSEQKASEGEYEDYIIENNILDVDTGAEAINETRLRYTTNGLDNNREIALTVPTIEPWNAPDAVHFGDAGGGRAVAWIRFGETTDAEGKRVLVIDEIQSKRHQEGREKGYRPSNIEQYLKDNGVEVIETGEFYEFHKNGELDKRFSKGLLHNDINRAKQMYVGGYVKSDIPSAPFEKNWAELAMKRMLRYAAENGYDKVAWTTGEQQADRYNMSNYFNSIKRFDIESMPGRRFELIGSTNIGVNVDEEGKIISSSMSELEGKPLADVVGKEMAVKMMQMENNTSLEDADLKIGGSGMKAFYDQMLPSFVRKYAKKWGATVGEVTMPSLEENNTMHSVDVTPAMRESVMQGQPLFSLKDEVAFNNKVEDARQIAYEYNIPQAIFITDTTDEYIALMHDMGYKNFNARNRRGRYIREEDVICLNGGNLNKRRELFGTTIHEYTHSVTHKLMDELKAIKDTLNEADILALRDKELPQYKEISTLQTLNEIISKFVGNNISRRYYNALMKGEVDIKEIMSDILNDGEYQEIMTALAPIIIKNLELQKQHYNERREGSVTVIPRRERGFASLHRDGEENLLEGDIRELEEGRRGDRSLRHTLSRRRGVEPLYHLKDNVEEAQDVRMTPAEIRAHMFENITRHHEREVNRINRFYDREERQAKTLAKKARKEAGLVYPKNGKITDRLQFLMPYGKTAYPMEWQVVHDIANGLKVKWSDSKDGKKRGLSTELGLGSSRKEKYGAITTGAQMYVEDYVAQLVEENDGYNRGIDDNDVRSIVLDALSQYTRPKEALDALEQQFLVIEEDAKLQESIDYIERARAEALQAEDEKFEAQKASYDKNPRKFERDYFSRMEKDLRWLNLKEHEIRIMRDKIQRIRADHKSSKATRAQYLAEVKEDIKRFLSNMSGRNISISEARFILNALEKATSVENVSYLLNRIATIEYYATNRVEQERKARLLKMKLSFFIPEKNQSVEQYLEQEKISRADAAAFISRFEEGNVGDDMTVFRAAFKDRYKGVDSKGVTVAKLIDAETAEIMKFISKYAYEKVDNESLKKSKAALFEEAERLKKTLPFSESGLDKLDQAYDIILEYWIANAEREEIKKFKSYIDEVEAKINEAWKDGDHNLLSQLRAQKDALIKERATYMPGANEALKNANDAVERLLLNGKRLLSEERDAQRQHDIEALNDVVNDITNFGADYQELMMKSRDHKKQAKEERKAKRLKVVREWTDSFNQLLTYLAPYAEGGKGLTYTRFMSNVHKAIGECSENMDMVNHQINDAITRIFGKQFRYKNLSQIMHRAESIDLAEDVTLGFEKVGKDLIPYKWHLNMANALYVLAAWNQADGRVKLEANGVTEEDIAYVENLIREKDARFLDFMYWVIQELLPSRREGRYNEVFRKATGRWMPYIENYFPIHILPSARHTEADVSEYEGDTKSVSPSAIKERTFNTNMVDLNTDFFKALMDNLTSMETWASLAEVERDMNTILSNNRAKDLMNARLGIDFSDRLKTAMQITFGTLTSGKVGGTERRAMNVARMWGATKIGFRLSTALKQLSGAGAMLAYTSNPLFMVYVFKNLAPTDAAEMLPILKKRWEDGLLGNVGLMDLSKGDTHISSWLDRVSERKADVVSTITKIGMYPNKVIDYYVSAVMAKSVYQYELQRYKKLGYSDAEAKRRALMDAEDSYNKTQQSSEMAYLSSGQVNPNILYRGLNVFMNNSIANFRIGLSGLEDMARGLGRFQKAQRYYRKLAEKRLYDKYIAEGKSEEDALQQAEQEALKQHRGMKRMGYIAQGLQKVAWGWFGANLLFSYMSILPYMWWGDDDERKEEMRRMLWFSAFFAPLQLIPWSKVAWDFGAGLWNKWRGRSLASNALPMLEGIEEMITSGVDMMQTLQEGEDISMAQWYNTLNAVSILGVGVDMDTFMNITDGIIDMEHGDWMEGTLDLLSVPNSQVKLLVGDRKEGEDWNKYMTRILRTRSILDKNKVDASEAAKYDPQTQKWVGETSLTTSQKSDIKKMYNRYEEMYQQDVLRKLRPNMEWYEVEKRYAEIMDELGWTPNKAAPKGVANVELPVEVMNTLRYLQGNSSAMITQKQQFVGKDEEYAKKLDVIYQDRKQLIQLYDDNVK